MPSLHRLSRLTLLAACVLAVPAALRADPPDDADDVPVVGRPADFNGGSGHFKVAARVERIGTEVPTALSFTLTVKADGPARRPPQRLNLAKRDEFTRDFYVEDGKDLHPDEATWEFTYRLTPKRLEVAEVPGVRFVFYNPALASTTRPFQTIYTDPIVVPVPLVAPASAFEIATGPAVLTRPLRWPVPGVLVAVLLLLAPPAGCVAWWLVWRRLYPDVARRTRQRRSWAARRALSALHQVRSLAGAALADRAAAVMTDYLHERLDLAVREPTPAEAHEHLLRHGAPVQRAEEVGRFFQACDAARFVPAAQAGPELAAEAERIILAVEEAAECPSHSC
jgi:hypothetical protein